MTKHDLHTQIRAELSTLHSELSRYSYPLFALDSRGRPELYSSCVVLQWQDSPVLVTAAHAITEITNTGSQVYLGGRHILALSPHFELSSTRASDVLDVAVMRCPAELIGSGEVDVLPLARTTLHRQFSNTLFHCIHGYPLSKNKQTKRIDVVNRLFTKYAFTYAGVSGDDSVNYSAFNKDSRIHSALVYEDVGWSEAGERLQAPPHPRGISGGGSWLVPFNSNPFQADASFLDGIAIEYHKRHSLVFSTRIEHAVHFVRDSELRKL